MPTTSPEYIEVPKSLQTPQQYVCQLSRDWPAEQLLKANLEAMREEVCGSGGLAETITEYDADKKSGNGFVFDKYNAKDMIRAVKRALKLYKKTESWNELQLSVMQEDFSWDQSAQNYLDLYVKMHEES